MFLISVTGHIWSASSIFLGVFFLTFVLVFQISSTHHLLKVQEQLGAELQKQIKTLSDKEEEHKKMHEKKSEELKELEGELKDLQSHAEAKEKQLGEADAHILSLEKQTAELENAAQETKKESEVK